MHGLGTWPKVIVIDAFLAIFTVAIRKEQGLKTAILDGEDQLLLQMPWQSRTDETL